jgi:hypothetical protein
MCCAFEVVPPMLESAHDCKRLLVIGLIVLFGINELTRLKGDWMLLWVAIANLLEL